jgi:hypothetical protein
MSVHVVASRIEIIIRIRRRQTVISLTIEVNFFTDGLVRTQK